MGFDHVTFHHTLPELDQRLRAAHEARAAAFRAAWKAGGRAISAALRRFLRVVEAVRRSQRAERTRNALGALSDRDLKDIGLTRGDIHEIAEAVADAPADSRVTFAEVRGLRSPSSKGRAERAPLPGGERRRGGTALAREHRGARAGAVRVSGAPGPSGRPATRRSSTGDQTARRSAIQIPDRTSTSAAK